MQHETGSFTGLDATPIFTQSWLPDGPPHAQIVLAHGIGEHSGRYAHVAAHVTAHGLALHALDHRGHGLSGGARLWVKAFDDFATDLRTFIDARCAAASVPLFLYGHSMGALIALRTVQHSDAGLAGLILSGTPLKPAGDTPLVRVVLGALERVLPRARLVPGVKLEDLSTDPAVGTAYAADPLVQQGMLPLHISFELLRARSQARAALPGVTLPVLVLHGAQDALTLPDAAHQLSAALGTTDLTVRLYPGLRHEVHNEPAQGTVLDDLTTWVTARLGA